MKNMLSEKMQEKAERILKHAQPKSSEEQKSLKRQVVFSVTSLI